DDAPRRGAAHSADPFPRRLRHALSAPGHRCRHHTIQRSDGPATIPRRQSSPAVGIVNGNSEERGMIQLTHEAIDYHALTELVRRPHCGGVVLFLGTVRDLTDGKVTTALDYEAYPGMAEKKLVEIESDTRSRWPIGEIALVHRLGH